MRSLPLALVTACSAPMMMTSHVGPSVQIDGDGLTGGEVAASYAFSGFGLAAHAFVERLERTELDVTRRSTALGIDFATRLSLFGLIADDHRLEHWFDVGLSGGAGGGGVKPASRLESVGHAWVGGFVSLGLWKTERYPSLMLEIRRETIGSNWDDRTVFTVGISLTRRTAETPRLLD